MDSFALDTRTRKDLEEAARRFLKANGMPEGAAVAVDGLDRGVARLRLKARGGETAYAFARQARAGWEVFVLGTFFEPDYCDKEGIPASLRL